MHPANLESLSHVQENRRSRAPQQAQDGTSVTRSISGIRRLRSDESWIEVSSQPSSSSLSSAATDEVVTTGLRVQHGTNTRRRRRFHPSAPSNINLPERPSSAAGSSQEEYEESESESDRIMSSSNEDLQPRFTKDSPAAPPSTTSEDASLDEDDEDENSTALGVTNPEPVFTPQPNAFSHPPVSQPSGHAHSLGVPDSYFPAPHSTPTRSAAQRHSYPSQRARSHTPYNMISPSYQADHDAALRASLSTLLSCAAAARGLPKRDQTAHAGGGSSNRVEPSSLRMVPEAVVMGENVTSRRLVRQLSDTSASAPSIPGKGKRKAMSRDRRDTKKKRHASVDEMMISPTLMTWVVSAGVVVLFSAISFSAGYAYGKEVGRLDAGLNTGGEGMACGKEVGRSLRRFRWGTSSTVVNV